MFNSTYANITVWLAQILFFFGLVSQIILNFRLKSTKGLSDLWLILLFNGYLAQIFYTYSLDFPFSYKVMVPLSTLAVLVIIGQRFYYSDLTSRRNINFLKVFIVNLLAALFILPFAVDMPADMGYWSGFLMTILWAIYLLPQVYKIFITKSVEGFSFTLVSLVAVGNFMEFTSAVMLHLPYPTILNNFRAIFFYLLICLQFLLYK